MIPTILTVISKPAVDKTSIIPNYRLGEIHRPQEVIVLPGGKGLNVARSARTLGAEVFSCVLIGGHAGHWMMDALAKEGIPAAAAWFPGETRACFSVIDPENCKVTEVFEEGPVITDQAWQDFEDLVVQHAADAGWVCLSGSLPGGAPSDGYGRIMQRIPDRPILLDMHSRGIQQSIGCRPLVVKINQFEAAQATGFPIDSPQTAAQAAVRLQEMGAQSAVITLGKIGAVGIDFNSELFGWKAPVVSCVSATGSGDAFLAGVAVGLQRGLDLKTAARLGAAAGAANTLMAGAGRFKREDADRLYAAIQDLPLDQTRSS